METIFHARCPSFSVIHSFEEFAEYGIYQLLDALTPITLVDGTVLKPIDYDLGLCSHTEADKDDLLYTSPDVCRKRDLSLSAPIYIKVLQNADQTQELFLGYLPVMVGSKMCTPDPVPDPSDPGGYFVIRGLERVFIGFEGQRNNAPIFTCEKDLWACEVISHPTSSRLRMTINAQGNIQVIMKNHMKKPLSLLHFIRALGCTASLTGLLIKESDDMSLITSVQPTLDQHAWALDDFEPLLTYYAPNKVQHALQHFLLPQVGSHKVYWLVRWARALIEVRAGMRPCTDRDHLAEKRVKIAGDLLHEFFRRELTVYWTNLEKKLNAKLRTGKGGMGLTSAVRYCSNLFTNRFQYAMSTGNWGKGVNGVTRQGEADKSYLARFVAIRRTHAHLAANSTRIIKPRQLHGSHWGYYCPAETPAGGDKIGFTKNLSVTAEITAHGDEVFWDKALRSQCISLHTVAAPRAILNGRIIGTLQELSQGFAALKALVKKDPPFHTSVIMGEDEVWVDTSAGRYVRPLYKVPLMQGPWEEKESERRPQNSR